ncbi:LysR family transcriptional regulator [Pseudoponticoccus marisrubri]|uniref:LysR family transcriptional regulator n=1 Tax=Pseudoponticoccus marisrubri TaxID=1685382 RepID=A0A0W7WKF1_9RHOB|nr:LysR family transcriptional regulator [Pseudoponticoccus marisrubri]KUF11085.1 LysR family transcriptional regulator [Pseudoponticoccus marisrubri]
MRINFDFHDLEAFLAVFETRSFHRAAGQLALSQTSVTRRVRKLEEALGTRLFDRTTREVRPTLAAKRLKLRAEAILQDTQETMRAMRDESAAFAHQRAQTVTVAAIPTVIGALVAPAVEQLRAEGHAPRLRLIDLAANEVAETVAEGEADFGIGSIPMLEPVTEFTPLLDDPIGLALPSGHPLLARETLRWSDLRGLPLILPARGTGNRLLIDEALARGQSPLRWSCEVGRTTTALELVARGIGLAPLPRIALGDPHGGPVRWRALSAPEVMRPIGLMTRFGQADTPIAASLKQAIVTLAAAPGGLV